MSADELLSKKAHEDVSRLVGEIEAKTSAEIVVVVRAVSGQYLHADLIAGAVLAFAWICVFLFHPAPFDDDLVPAQMLAAFVLGMLLSVYVGPLRRTLTPKSWRDENVERAARAAFVEHGVFRTRGRTGILVFVSTFERRAALVGDVGIETADLGTAFTKAQTEIESSIGKKESVTAFGTALRELGTKLKDVFPRAEDDVNELPNEVVT